MGTSADGRIKKRKEEKKKRVVRERERERERKERQVDLATMHIVCICSLFFS